MENRYVSIVQKYCRTHGFTLVELLVVISIMALLLSILVPSLQKARSNAKKLICGANLKQISYACAIYAQQNNGSLPICWYGVGVGDRRWPWQLVNTGAIQASGIFNCPATKSEFKGLREYPKGSGKKQMFVQYSINYQPQTKIDENTGIVIPGLKTFQIKSPGRVVLFFCCSTGTKVNMSTTIYPGDDRIYDAAFMSDRFGWHSTLHQTLPFVMADGHIENLRTMKRAEQTRVATWYSDKAMVQGCTFKPN